MTEATWSTGRDDRLIVGNCRQFRFRPETESIFQELSGRQVMQRAKVGKPLIEIAASAARRLRTSSTARIRHIVFLNRHVHRQEMVPFPTEVARLSTCFSARAPCRESERQA